MSFDDSRFFDLATPDPEFPDFTVLPEDQLPGRITEGRLEIGPEFFRRHFTLFFTEEQQTRRVRGGTIYDRLKAMNAPVLGPNVGQFLYERQKLIPVELRGKVAFVFWGEIFHITFGENRYVRYLAWDGLQWSWFFDWVDGVGWDDYAAAVLLVR